MPPQARIAAGDWEACVTEDKGRHSRRELDRSNCRMARRCSYGERSPMIRLRKPASPTQLLNTMKGRQLAALRRK
jgi:hypothetical protein